MEITKRQCQILNWIVRDYIELRRPISSDLIERKHKIGISSPMIRIEMQRLTEKGYIQKPYQSAGRIPTDKGYRFFVDRVMERIEEREIEFEEIQKIEDTFRLVHLLTKYLADATRALVLSYLKEKEILFKEGWDVLKEPEFENKNLISRFLKFLVEFENKIEQFGKEKEDIEVFIGKEIPIRGAKDFSLIFSKCCLPEKKEGIFALLGPKRMNYSKNIALLNSLRKFLEKL